MLPLLPLAVVEELSGVVAADGLDVVDGVVDGVLNGGVLAMGLGVVVVVGGVDELRPQPASAAIMARAIKLGAGRNVFMLTPFSG